MKKTIKNYFSSTAILGVLLTLIVLFWEVSDGVNPLSGSMLNRIENLLYDYRFRLTLSEQENTSENNIVILDIDEESLVAEGRWPWSRIKIAQLVNKLADQGALVVAFDIVFSESERNPATELLEHYPTKNLTNELRELESIADADALFAKSFEDIDVILGYFFDSETRQVGALPPPVREYGESIMEGFITPSLPGIISNLEVLQSAAAGSGSVFTLPDADGVIRRSPLVSAYKGNLYPSLSLAAGMAYLFSEDIELYTSKFGDYTSINAIGISEFLANTDTQGNVLVPYIGKQGSFPYVSATDVLNDKVESNTLDSAIVLVGTSALGLRDLRTTPFETGYPGVEVHANILKGLLEGGIPFQPDWQTGLVRVLILLIGLVLSIALPRLASITMIAAGLSTVLIYQGLNYFLWAESRFDLAQAPFVILIIGLTTLNISLGFFKESSRRKDLKNMFGQYVPPAHIDKLVDSGDQSDALASDTRIMTVLFADIRSFTTISENLSAEELKQMLNEYFTPITKIIFETEGTIDKYVGDMVMAFWGAPIADAHHNQHALEAAAAMLLKTKELKVLFKEKGLPEISIGIGLNTGSMNVGDMGSNYRKAYTVLGDAVNLASRLESLTKYYGVDCLVGEQTTHNTQGLSFREIDKITVKGKTESVHVFEPLGETSQLSAKQIKDLEDYHSALAAYRNQKWDKAEATFKSLAEQFPEQALYQLYLNRITENRVANLALDWDGSYNHTSK